MNEFINFDAIRAVVGDDDKVHRRLYQAYIDSAEECVTKITNAFKEKDLESVSSIGHKLKSASRTVGALKVTEIAERLEKQVMALEDDELMLLIKELSDQQSIVEKLLLEKISHQ